MKKSLPQTMPTKTYNPSKCVHLLERLCMYIINTIINTIYRLCVASK